MKSQAIVIDSLGNRIAFVMADEYVLKKGESKENTGVEYKEA